MLQQKIELEFCEIGNQMIKCSETCDERWYHSIAWCENPYFGIGQNNYYNFPL